MSTRANIIVKDETEIVQLYRHMDGYPSAVLPDLLKVFPYAWGLPRFEASDFAAAIVAAWKTTGGGNVYINATPDRADLAKGLTGWVEYLYLVEYDGARGVTVTVFDVDEKPDQPTVLTAIGKMPYPATMTATAIEEIVAYWDECAERAAARKTS